MLPSVARFVAVPLLLLPPALASVSVSACGTAAQCGAVEDLPVTLTVVDAVTGAPVCDPTFVITSPVGLPDAPDGGAVRAYACHPDDVDCPSAPSDGGIAPCAFQLDSLAWPGSYTVRVSAPGFEPAAVDDLSAGAAGCVPYVAPSIVTVKLAPSTSGAGDAG